MKLLIAMNGTLAILVGVLLSTVMDLNKRIDGLANQQNGFQVELTQAKDSMEYSVVKASINTTQYLQDLEDRTTSLEAQASADKRDIHDIIEIMSRIKRGKSKSTKN